MKNLSIKAKLMLLSIVPLLALIYFTAEQTIHSLNYKNELERTQNLVSFTKKISLLIHETQKERGMSAGYVGSHGQKFKDLLPKQRELTDKRKAEFESFIKNFDFSEYANLKKHTQKINNFLAQLKTKRTLITTQSISLKDTVSYYTNMNKTMLAAVGELAKQSPSNEITKMLVGYTSFLKAKERAGIERAVLSGVFAKNSFPQGFYQKFVKLVSLQEAYIDTFKTISDKNIISFYEKKMQDPSVLEVNRLRAIANKNATIGNFGVDSVHWFKTITKKINLLKEVDDKIADEITNKISTLASSSMTAAFGGMVIILFASILTFIIRRDIDQRIKNLRNTIDTIANQKDFSKEVKVTSTDEFSQIQKSLGNLVNSVKQALSQAKNSAYENEKISNNLVQTFQNISENIQNETNVVDSISKSSKELEQKLLETQEEATETKTQTQHAKEKIEEAKKVISNTITQIQANAHVEQDLADKLNNLSADADQVKGVLSIIGDIADQTNLLALNAAIEAARAGEHGRGFAVVADEVRQLAEKTQKSLIEINATISVIVQAILDASQDMNANISNIDSLISNTDRIQEDMDQISHNMDSIYTNIENTDNTISQSAKSMQLFEKHMKEIIQLSNTNSKNVTVVGETTQAIKSSSKELMTTLDNFKT